MLLAVEDYGQTKIEPLVPHIYSKERAVAPAWKKESATFDELEASYCNVRTYEEFVQVSRIPSSALGSPSTKNNQDSG